MNNLTLRTTILGLLAVSAPAAAQSPFAYNASLPLAAQTAAFRTVDGVQVREIAYNSPKGGRVTGLLYLPGARGRRPGVLLGHGAPGNSRGERTQAYAVALAKSGAIVLSIDAPWARRNGPPVTFTPADSADQVQLIVDLRRGLDYLASRPDVDPARLGYFGNSYGGAQGALLVGVDDRIRAAVLRVADGGFIAHFSDPCETEATGSATITGCLQWAIPEADLPAEQRERWAEAMWPVEPIHAIGRTQAKLLFQSALKDEAVSSLRAARLHEAAPSRTSRVEWYNSGHRLPNDALVSAVKFLHDELGLAEPTQDFAMWVDQRIATP